MATLCENIHPMQCLAAKRSTYGPVHLSGRDDPSLVPLWEFVVDLLEVDIISVLMEQGEPRDDRFRDTFMLSFHRNHPEPGDWSKGSDLVDDSISVISIDSIHY